MLRLTIMLCLNYLLKLTKGHWQVKYKTYRNLKSMFLDDRNSDNGCVFTCCCFECDGCFCPLVFGYVTFSSCQQLRNRSCGTLRILGVRWKTWNDLSLTLTSTVKWGAGIRNAFGIPMVALCLVFQWHSTLNKMAAILFKTIGRFSFRMVGTCRYRVGHLTG